MTTKVLTVAELIAKLQTMPPDLPVDVEGCDCYQWAVDVSAYTDFDGKSIVLVESISHGLDPEADQ